MKKLDAHSIAGLFPLVDDVDLEHLAADIQNNGLQVPITIYEGKILDGRNRYTACGLAGVEPTFSEYSGNNPLAYVISLNLHRRHLDESQRAMIAARIATIPKHKHKNSDAQICASQPEAAEMLNVSRRTVQGAAVVLKQGTPELINAVDKGRLPVSVAARWAKSEPQEQKRLIEVDRKKTSDVHVSYNSGNNEWNTPAELMEMVHDVMGGVDCDPASNEAANLIVKATKYFTAKDDGLQRTWGKRVFMNPPYAQPIIGEFAKAVVKKYTSGEIEQACVLVNNATETEWGQALLGIASAVCFLKGRVKFLDGDGKPVGAPLQGQMMLYLGIDIDDFCHIFSSRGIVYAASAPE